MIDTLIPVWGLALLDSLNPSALAMTLYLLTQRHYTSKVLVYVAGIFATYLSLGVLILIGLGTFLSRLGDATEHPLIYGLQGVLGAGLLLYALIDPHKGKPQRPTRLPRSLGLGALFLLGVTITGVEFTTALPYLGAIGLLTNANLALGQQLPVLVAYNAIFVLPPLLLLLAYRFFAARLRDRLARLREKLQAGSREAWLWILGSVGFLLLADSLRYFEFLRLVR